MTLRTPLEHDVTLPDGRSVRVRVGVAEDAPDDFKRDASRRYDPTSDKPGHFKKRSLDD